MGSTTVPFHFYEDFLNWLTLSGFVIIMISV